MIWIPLFHPLNKLYAVSFQPTIPKNAAKQAFHILETLIPSIDYSSCYKKRNRL